MCVKCVSKCEVILGEKNCDDGFQKRILPDETFIANSTLHVKNKTIASRLLYQTYNGSMILSDAVQDNFQKDLFSDLLIFSILLYLVRWQSSANSSVARVDLFAKNSVDGTVNIKTDSMIKKKKKKKKKYQENPATWGLYSKNYSEC